MEKHYGGRHQNSWTAALAPRYLPKLPKATPYRPGEWRRIDLILGTSFGRDTRSFRRDMGTEPEIGHDQVQFRSTCKRIVRVTNPPSGALSDFLIFRFIRLRKSRSQERQGLSIMISISWPTYASLVHLTNSPFKHWFFNFIPTQGAFPEVAVSSLLSSVLQLLDPVIAVSCNNMDSSCAHCFGNTLRDELYPSGIGIGKFGFEGFHPCS